MLRFHRRLWRVGNSTVVAIPVPWLEGQGLSAGDLVVLEVNGGLKVVPKRGERQPPERRSDEEGPARD